MRPTVQFLNVGWGDAHFITMPSGKITLIDGGDGSLSSNQDHPLDWMDREGISALDLMILTHIHEDHVNGLIDIARSRKVHEAILPYELPVLPLKPVQELEGKGFSPYALRVHGMLRDYLVLIDLLTQQGTQIRFRSAHGSAASSIVWEEEGYTFTHLYPWQGDPQPGLDILHRIASGEEHFDHEDERTESLAAFFEKSNDDSSVYRLCHRDDEAGGIMLGGDQLTPGWDHLSQRAEVKSRVWKVPHHGMEDAFQPEMLSRIDPEICVIPVSIERSAPLMAHWDSMAPSSRAVFHLTGSTPPGERTLLLEGPIEVWIGS